MALPAFAAERRAAAVCCGAVAAGHPPLSRGQTYGQTDGRTPDRYIDPVAYAMRAVAVI